MAKIIKSIINSQIEPSNTNVLWLKDSVLKGYVNGVWKNLSGSLNSNTEEIDWDNYKPYETCEAYGGDEYVITEEPAPQTDNVVREDKLLFSTQHNVFGKTYSSRNPNDPVRGKLFINFPGSENYNKNGKAKLGATPKIEFPDYPVPVEVIVTLDGLEPTYIGAIAMALNEFVLSSASSISEES